MGVEAAVQDIAKQMQVAASIKAAADQARAQNDFQTAWELLSLLDRVA